MKYWHVGKQGTYTGSRSLWPNSVVDFFLILVILKIKVKLMLYTKFQPSDSGEKVGFSGLAIFSNSGHFLFPTSPWVGWSGGTMVLGKLPVPGRPTI